MRGLFGEISNFGRVLSLPATRPPPPPPAARRLAARGSRDGGRLLLKCKFRGKFVPSDEAGLRFSLGCRGHADYAFAFQLFQDGYTLLAGGMC